MGRRCVCLYTTRCLRLWETTRLLCDPQQTGKKETGFPKLFSTKKTRPSWIRGTGQRRFGLYPVNPSIRGMLGTWTKQNGPFAYGSIDWGNVDTGVGRKAWAILSWLHWSGECRHLHCTAWAGCPQLCQTRKYRHLWSHPTGLSAAF